MATATTTAVAQLNKVQYAGLDFPTHFDDLRSELQTKFAADFNDFALSSLAIMLLDITAYGLDSLSFYLDRRATDSYLETAQTRKAVARLTRQLGYKMGGAISAATDLDVRITVPVNFSVTIPTGYQFKGPNNLIFEAAQATTFAPRASTAQSIPVYEGETITETFVGDGTSNQVFQLQRVPAGKSVVQNSASVLVNGTPYTEAEFLPITGGQYYEVGYNDSPPTIRFGDGTVSQTDIPGPNSTISVTYIAAAGLAGQVNANTITKPVTPLVVNFTTIQLSINNPEAAVGGDDPESLDRAKSLAPLVYKSRRVAVTQSDYVALSSAYADPLFGRVAVAQAYSTRSADSDLELQTDLQSVRDIVQPIQADVDAQVALVTVETGNITTANTALTTTVSDIAASNTTSDASLATVATSLATASNRAVLATSRCNAGTTTVGAIPTAVSDSLTPATKTALDGSLTSLQTDIAGYPDLGVDSLTAATQTSLQAYITSALGTLTPVSTSVADTLTTDTKAAVLSIFSALTGDIGTMKSETDLSNVAVGAVQDAVVQVGLTPVDGYLATATTNVAATASAVTNIDTANAEISTLVAPLAASASGTESINAALDAIAAHVDAILAANCSANLITVPILTKDANGFYAAPSLGLKQSLQDYLDARKAVTQSVQVASGEGALIYTVLAVQIGVRQGYSENVVRLAAQSAIDGLLKNRTFGSSLYRSAITDTVLAVAGVAFVNPTIAGYYTAVDPTTQTTKLDSFGNLIIGTGEIVTKGTVAITTTSYAETTL